MAKRKPKGRNISGIVLLDKPIGMTSNAALQTVKRLFNASKAGHTGSLDPLATGLLPLCLGEATKISGFLLDADKHYIATCKLGINTTTADAEGEIISTRPVPSLDQARIEQVLEQFRGQISQIPPMHSAIKQNGQPLYKLAHQGIEVERKPRDVHIYSLNLIRHNGDELEIAIHCSKGTYIRTLAEDIGEVLGCGAHLIGLRRTGSGPFSLEQAVSIETLQIKAEQGSAALDTLLFPIENALLDWPTVKLSEDSAYYLQQGQAIQIARAPTSGLVCLFKGEDVFLGIGQILDDGRVAPKRLLRA